jgi:hypothetical protein
MLQRKVITREVDHLENPPNLRGFNKNSFVDWLVVIFLIISALGVLTKYANF